MSFEIVAALASTFTSGIIALVALLFSYRQNVGWKPVAFLSGESIRGTGGLTSFIVKVEVWNRRKYPIVVRRLALTVSASVEILNRDPKEPGGEYVRDNVLRRDVSKPIAPGEHMTFDLQVQFSGQSLDAMCPLIRVEIWHFDPYRERDRVLEVHHPFFYPQLGWKLSDKQRNEARERYVLSQGAPPSASAQD